MPYFFAGLFSTAENVAVYIWEELKACNDELSRLLYEVKVCETEKNSVFYRGETE